MPAETATLSPAMERLKKAGAALASANRRRERAVSDLRDAIRAADAEPGTSRTQIQEVAGVARQTVYDALKPDRPASPHTATVDNPDGTTTAVPLADVATAQ